jgi:hypothetical protein
MCLKSSVITSVKQALNSLTNPWCVKVLSSLTNIFVVLPNLEHNADFLRAWKYISPYLYVPFHKTEKSCEWHIKVCISKVDAESFSALF